MKVKTLKTDFELETYRHAIANSIDVLLPLDYLKQGKVYRFFNELGHICGGFALITSGPYRVLSSIPNFEGFELDPKLKKTAEITGVWLSSEHRAKKVSLMFWMVMISKLLTCRKEYFVYAYSSKKEHLKKIYSRGNPVVLFSGETIPLPGMKDTDHESVEVVMRTRLFKQLFKNPDFFMKRLGLVRKTTKGLHEKFIPSFIPLTSPNIDFGERESEVNR